MIIAYQPKRPHHVYRLFFKTKAVRRVRAIHDKIGQMSCDVLCVSRAGPHLAVMIRSPESFVLGRAEVASAMKMSCDNAGTSGVLRFEVFTGAGGRAAK